MTDVEIRNGYLAKFGRPIDQVNLSAFYELMQMYDCADSTSFMDACERIIASLKIRMYGI